MALFLSIAALVVIALLATSKRAYRVRRSRLGAAAVAGGWIATAVGALLGPSVSGLITPDAVLRATPLLSVGLGWIGLMVGLQARRDILSRLPRAVWRLTLVDSALSVALVAGALIALAIMHGDLANRAGVVAVALLASASIGWSMETRSLGIDATTEGRERSVLLRASGGLSAIVAITLFGVVASVLPLDLTVAADRAPSSIPMRIGALAAASGVGVVLAIIAKEALRLASKRRDEMLVVFLGVVGLAAGVSADLGVSPLFPAMLTGATLANLRAADAASPAADTALFGRFILQAEHVIAVIMALLAGVLLDPTIPLIGVLAVGALVLARTVAKPLAFALVDRAPVADINIKRVARAAPIRQSPVAIALAVSLFILVPEVDAQRLLTVVVLVGFLCDLLAALAARRRPPLPEATP